MSKESEEPLIKDFLLEYSDNGNKLLYHKIILDKNESKLAIVINLKDDYYICFVRDLKANNFINFIIRNIDPEVTFDLNENLYFVLKNQEGRTNQINKIKFSENSWSEEIVYNEKNLEYCLECKDIYISN